VTVLALGIGTALLSGGAAHASAPEAGRKATPSATAGDESVLRAADNPFDLSDDQRERIAQIVSESGEHANRLKRELADARADLKTTLDAPEPDFDEVMRGVERVGRLETEVRKHQIATLMSLRAILSPEQRDALTEFLRAAAGHQQGRPSPDATAEARPPGEPARVTSNVPAAAETPASP